MSNFSSTSLLLIVGGQLVILTCLLDLVQAVVQTLFILEAMRRRSGKISQKLSKIRTGEDSSQRTKV